MIKRKILKANKKVYSMYRETKIMTTAGFTYSYIALAKQKIMEDGSQWNNIFKVLKQRTQQNQSPISRDFSTQRKYPSKFKAK